MTGAIINPQAPPVKSYHQRKAFLVGNRSCVRHPATRRDLTQSAAIGHGRDEDFSSPPAQIPACAANAPGSSVGFWRRSGDMAKGVAF